MNIKSTRPYRANLKVLVEQHFRLLNLRLNNTLDNFPLDHEKENPLEAQSQQRLFSEADKVPEAAGDNKD